MSGAPPRASDEAQREVADHHQTMLRAYKDGPLPWGPLAQKRAHDAARKVRGSPAETRHLRSIYVAMLEGTNPYYTTEEFLVKLAKAALPTTSTLSHRTIKEFAALADVSPGGGSKPHLRIFVDLLFLASLMLEHSHPALMKRLTPLALATSLDALAAFQPKKLAQPAVDETLMRIAGLGQDLYDAISMANLAMTSEVFDRLAETPFFQDIQSASSLEDIGEKTVGFVRLGTEDNEYVLGTSSFTRVDVPDDGSGEGKRSYFYIETTAEDLLGARIVASGFVVERKRGDVYLIQQHRDAAGFNITNLAGGEVSQMHGGFSRGLLLTYGKKGFFGGMAAKIAMFPIVPGAVASRVESRSELRAKMQEIAPGVDLPMLEDFLHIERAISLRSPIPSETGEKRVLDSWPQVVEVCRKILDEKLDVEGKKITQFVTTPLKAS